MLLRAYFVTQRDAVESQYTKANDELTKNREKLKSCDEQISALVKEQAVRKQELADCLLNQKRLDNEVFGRLALFSMSISTLLDR